MIRNRLRHAAVDRKRAAPVADVFAERNQRGVFVKLIDDGFRDAVAQLIDAVLADGFSVCFQTIACFLRDLLDTRALLSREQHIRLSGFVKGAHLLVGEHEVSDVVALRAIDVDAGRNGFVDGELHVAQHVVLDGNPDGVQLVLRRNLRLDDLLAKRKDRILRFPCFDLLLGTVGAGVRRTVPAEAIRHEVEQHGAFRLRDGNLSAVCVDDRERVEAVHALRMHGGGHYARRDARDHVIAHRFAARLTTHAIKVVVDVEDDRHAATVFAPKGANLIHRGDHQALPDRAAGDGTIANVANDHAGLLVAEFVERGTRCDAAAAADDCVVREDAKRREERVHGAAESLIKAVFTREGFAHHAVEQEVDRDLFDGFAAVLDDGKRTSVKEALHDLHELRIIENLDRAQTFSDDFAVAAVRTECVVVQRKFICRANVGRLLTDAKVSRAGMVVLHAAILVGGLDEVEHGFKLADIRHIAIDVEKLLFREVLLLILDALLVLVDRNRRERECFGFSDHVGIDENLLRHSYLLITNTSN